MARASSPDDDFARFAGPGAHGLRPSRGPRAPVWGALVFSFAWFYWRRLYVAGSLVLMPFLFWDLLEGGRAHPSGIMAIALLAPGLACPFLARTIYMLAYTQRCRRAARLGLDAKTRADYLERSGGVSRLGGSLAGILWLTLCSSVLKGLLPPKWWSWIF